MESDDGCLKKIPTHQQVEGHLGVARGFHDAVISCTRLMFEKKVDWMVGTLLTGLISPN